MKKTFFAILYSCIVSGTYATKLFVPSQYTTIQSAITAAVAGDTVEVAAGNTYVENINFMGKDIVVTTPKPATDKYTTTIDGSLGGSVVLFISNETNAATLSGFTITNGTGTLRSWWYYLGFDLISGGGILCDSPIAFNQAGNANGSSPTLSHLVVTNNTADFGGGIAAWKGSRPIIKNTIISNNSCTGVGAGYSIFEAFNTTSTIDALLENSLVYGNLCTGSVGGGGIITNYSSRLVINHCTIADNAASTPLGENLFRANGAFMQIYNSIITTGTQPLMYDQGGTPATSTLDYSCVSNTMGPVSSGLGNILLPPLFVNQTLFDYHLLAASPCIDAASPASTITIDLDSNLRDANPDMGCYEAGGVIPVAALQSSDTAFCDKNAIDFFDLSTNNPTSWLWTFTGATPSTSTLQNPTGIYYPSYGAFDVKLVACNSFGCDSIILVAFIKEFQLPNPPTVNFINDTLWSSPAFSYQWFLIPNPIPGANAQFYVPTQPGDYYVIISDTNGCEVPSTTITIANTSVITNPVVPSFSLTMVDDGKYLLHYYETNLPIRLMIIDALGKTVETIDVTNTTSVINLSDLPHGLYFARVSDTLLCKKILR